jgi:hypothetical protein
MFRLSRSSLATSKVARVCGNLEAKRIRAVALTVTYYPAAFESDVGIKFFEEGMVTLHDLQLQAQNYSGSSPPVDLSLIKNMYLRFSKTAQRLNQKVLTEMRVTSLNSE